MFALFLEFGTTTHAQDLWPFLLSETGLKFLVWTQGEICPSNRTDNYHVICKTIETSLLNVNINSFPVLLIIGTFEKWVPGHTGLTTSALH